MKKYAIVLVLATIIALCCAACGSNDPFSQGALAPYETLIGATDAEVVNNLGAGNPRYYETEENGTTYNILFDRTYEGNLFDPNGTTAIQYLSPDRNDVISGAYEEGQHKVSCIIMSGILPIEEGTTLHETLKQKFGAPTQEENPFANDQSYTAYWVKEDCSYQFWYEPNGNDPEKENCGILFAILDKTFLTTDLEPVSTNSEV